MTRIIKRAFGATLLVALPAFAQAQAENPDLVTGSVEVPAVADLQSPSERVGEFFETEDGARIFYEVAGDGPPMLLLHGYPLSGALFARLRDTLQDDYTVLTVDHRGYGLSEAPETPDDVAVYAEDALAVMDSLGLESAVVGGMSMGGPIAFSMYQQAPDRVEGLVLMDTNAAAAAPPEAGLWEGIAEVASSAGIEPIIASLLPDMLTGETRLNEPAVADYLTSIMEGSSVDAYIGGATALAERPDFTDLLANIDVPALIIVGLEDSLYGIEVARDMAEALPNADLAIIPGASHAAVFEAPGAVGSAIQSWASDL